MRPTTTTLTDAPARDALAAVFEALDIPHGATVGDQEIRDRILLERAGHARVMLASVLDPDRAGHPDVEWSVGYLRARLAEHPATGYKTWQERVAEHPAEGYKTWAERVVELDDAKSAGSAR
jgi:hypothetical protein